MAWFLLARLLFVIAVVYSAVLLRPLGGSGALNAAFGVALAVVFVAFESRLRNTSVTHMLGAMLGGAIGLGIAKTVGAALFWADTKDDRVAFLHSFVLLALPYLGLVLGGRKGEWLEPARLIGLFRGTGPQRRYRILDTSVIIDGRVADICETGFLDGTLVIPQFVLKELQLVADSSDSMKRNRGRRGLDILQKMQKMSGIDVMISDLDFPEVREVDLKLIELARALSGKIVTNDFNLNKVAQLRGVAVLNINELANSLKPVVLPGEIMRVFILKEGKEFNQGVAYLDDGTMVVVDNARKLIGKTIDVVVTSVLQTTAGKMIFGRFVDPSLAGSQGSGPRARRASPSRRAGAAATDSRLGRGVCRGDGDGGRTRVNRRQRRRGRAVARVGRGHSVVSLVADGLLPHPRHRGLHRRPRHAVAWLEPRRSARAFRAWLRAVVVVADSGDDRRERGRARPGPAAAGYDLHLRLESPEHLRHPRRLRVAALPAPHHREGVARQLSVPRLAPEAHGAPAGRPEEPGPRRHPAPVEGAGRAGAVAHHLS